MVQDVGGGEFQTAGIRRYVEDLEPGPNPRIGPKDFFEMASVKLGTINHMQKVLAVVTETGPSAVHHGPDVALVAEAVELALAHGA